MQAYTKVKQGLAFSGTLEAIAQRLLTVARGLKTIESGLNAIDNPDEQTEVKQAKRPAKRTKKDE